MHNIHNKNAKESPLKTHYLSSILPFAPNIQQPEQITKTKDFYKPEQFIWNNPHRTSKRIYPYYHRFNDTYIKEKKPEIDKLQEEDRRNLQFCRIQKLSSLRNETRQKFYSRQKLREDLQIKSGSRLRQNSTIQVKSNKKNKIYEPYATGYPTSSISPSFEQNKCPKSERQLKTISGPQKSFVRGVENYDQNLTQIRKLVSEQVSLNHQKIRQQFQRRKQVNNLTNSRIKKSSVLLTKQMEDEQ